MGDNSLNIAVVGAGPAGLTAAYLLQRRHQVTVFEKAPQAGGHCFTWTIPGGPDKGLLLDLGFLGFRLRENPNFVRLLQLLEVPTASSEWSFAFFDEKTRYQYALTGWPGYFTRLHQWASPAFLEFLRERAWFHSRIHRDLERGRLEGAVLGAYLRENRYSPGFLRDYVLPLGASIWGLSVKAMEDMPAGLFADRLPAHLPHQRHQWRRIEKGSSRFITALLNKLKFRVKVAEPVEGIKRKFPIHFPGETADHEADPKGQVILRGRDGKESVFDKVVLACHADEALGLLHEPTEDEQRLLSPWRYQKNHVLLHTDDEILPPSRRSWAAWNYIREIETTKSEPVAVTGHLNRLMGLTCREQYFITLNRVRPIPEKHALKEAYFTHPVPTLEALRTRSELEGLNGRNHTYFCGSYFGQGALEDAVRSALQVGRLFGIEL
ncbi:MAG TPA: FAD-dependent oxidoreductase [bacterium]|nr:FAD-dependent oxidoreductase [bacterium]